MPPRLRIADVKIKVDKLEAKVRASLIANAVLAVAVCYLAISS